ncbi:MAG: site-specific DNA-methyltransferase [Treponema sp.]|jgi:hypothetical protein|nr:site-specific DNA-methyltransferase [Treponema sp.]
MAEQLYLFNVDPDINTSTSTTFIDNMRLPIHRWFRYSAGFSAEWVKKIIKKYAKTGSMILDPFAGSGTTLVAANELSILSLGYEKHYFVRRIAETKLHYSVDFNYLDKLYNEIITLSASDDFDFETQPDLLKRCYAPEVLETLVSIKNNFLKIADNTCDLFCDRRFRSLWCLCTGRYMAGETRNSRRIQIMVF